MIGAVRRLVVVGAAGGEGASAVARVAAHAAFASGRVGGVLTRPDDPGPTPTEGGVAGSHLVVDAGPHGADGTGRPGDVAILVCAANTGAIERARALMSSEDQGGGGRVFAALVITARSRGEQRRARVRLQQAASDPRTLVLRYDPELRFGRSSREPATVSVGRQLAALLGGSAQRATGG